MGIRKLLSIIQEQYKYKVLKKELIGTNNKLLRGKMLSNIKINSIIVNLSEELKKIDVLLQMKNNNGFKGTKKGKKGKR